MRVTGGLGLGMPETRAEEWRLGNAAGEGENQGGRRWWRFEIGGQVEGGGGEGECRMLKPIGPEGPLFSLLSPLSSLLSISI